MKKPVIICYQRRMKKSSKGFNGEKILFTNITFASNPYFCKKIIEICL